MKLHSLLSGFVVALCAAAPVAAQTPATWDSPVKVVAAAGSVTKSAGCEGCPDSGAHSAVQMTGDGYVEFVPSAGHRIIAGLGRDLSASTDAASIDYGFSLWPGNTWEVRERGVYRADGASAPGDRFRVAVEGGKVVYRKNGAVVYTSKVAPSFPMALDVTLFSVGATLWEATVTGVAAPGTSTPTAPTTPAAPTTPTAPTAPTTPAAPGTGGGPAVAAVGPYAAVVDRQTYAKPALPVLAGAGATALDPVFQSTITRITDSTTRPGYLNQSYRTPSATHQNTWSARLSYFYVVSGDGSSIPYTFDQATGKAQRINPTATGHGGMTLSFYIEPQFSYVSDSIIYGSYNGSGGNLHSIDQFDFSTSSYGRILDLETVVPGLAGTYIGGVGSSAGATERLMAFFGGVSQDKHNYAIVFDKANPANRSIVDTAASTVNGRATAIPLNFKLHHVAIDRGGRYLMLYPTHADQSSAPWITGDGCDLPVSSDPAARDAVHSLKDVRIGSVADFVYHGCLL